MKAVLVLALVTATAHAEPPSLTPTVPDAVDDKSPAVALALSAGTTLAGIGMMAAGDGNRSAGLTTAGLVAFAIGPTVGHAYAGHLFNPGLGVRALGAVAGVAGAVTILACGLDECHGGSADAGVALLYGGGALIAAGSLYEIVTAPRAATEHNRRLHLAIVPARGGLGLAGTF